jgi:hypothetical protein
MLDNTIRVGQIRRNNISADEYYIITRLEEPENHRIDYRMMIHVTILGGLRKGAERHWTREDIESDPLIAG